MNSAHRLAQASLLGACLAGGIGVWLMGPLDSHRLDTPRQGVATKTGAAEPVNADRTGLAVRQDLFGRVVDADGNPMSGVLVEYREPFDGEFASVGVAIWGDSPSGDHAQGKGFRDGVRDEGVRVDADRVEAAWGGASRVAIERAAEDPRYAAVTDALGQFSLEGLRAHPQGVLSYGARLFEGEPLVESVNPEGGEHVLVVPARGESVPTVRISVTDARTGLPMDVERVHPQLIRLPTTPELETGGSGAPLPRRALRVPRASQVRQGTGWVELELWPGTWRLEFAAELSSTHVVEVEVPRQGEPIELDLPLDVFRSEDGWEVLAPVVDGELVLDPEPGEGFSVYNAKHSPNRPLGETRKDLTFRHTLRFEPGDFTEAYLELDLEAPSSMTYNDSIGLEFEAPPRFLFHQHIAVLCGVWRAPTRRCLYLDLSDMVGFEGEVNLLPELSDGQLDIYVQDDTAVHDLRLFLRRR